MKIIRTTLVVTCLVAFAACEKDDKDSDKRSQFTGTYDNLKEEMTYIYDGATYTETEKKDTVSFSIEKVANPDSANYITLIGVKVSTKHTATTFRFEKNGTRIVGLITANGFTIPKQTPASPNVMTIEGTGEKKDGKLILNYHTQWQEYSKHGSIKQ